jgi:predicted Zn-dependent protease
VSPRTRIRLLVGAAALVAGALATGAALWGGGSEAASTAPLGRGAPALELSVLLRNDGFAKKLRAAERDYDGGRRAKARSDFAALSRARPESIPAAVGAAIAAWPDHTIARLRSLVREHPDSALARLHLGLALYASGDDAGAAAQWRAATWREPNTPSAVRADDLLHPDMAPGLPFFFSPLPRPRGLAGRSPQAQLDELERRARHGGADDWIQYGTALQRVGRPVSARTAFARAAALAPDSVSAQVAAAVGRFDKDNPSGAFSRLGPLARSHPDAAVVRFHLGLLLLWLRNVDEARKQLQRAVAADSSGFYGRQARALLSRLEAIGT